LHGARPHPKRRRPPAPFENRSGGHCPLAERSANQATSPTSSSATRQAMASGPDQSAGCGWLMHEACAQRVITLEPAAPSPARGAPPPAGAPTPTGFSRVIARGARCERVEIAHGPRLPSAPGSRAALRMLLAHRKGWQAQQESAVATKGTAATAQLAGPATNRQHQHQGPPGIARTVSARAAHQGRLATPGRQTAAAHTCGAASGPPGRMARPGPGQARRYWRNRQGPPATRGVAPALRCQMIRPPRL